VVVFVVGMIVSELTRDRDRDQGSGIREQGSGIGEQG